MSKSPRHTRVDKDQCASQTQDQKPSQLLFVSVKAKRRCKIVRTFSFSFSFFSPFLIGVGLFSFSSSMIPTFFGSAPRLYNKCRYTDLLSSIKSSKSVNESCSTYGSAKLLHATLNIVCQRSVVRDIRLQSSWTDAFLESEVVGGLVDGIEEGCGMSACCAERHDLDRSSY